MEPGGEMLFWMGEGVKKDQFMMGTVRLGCAVLLWCGKRWHRRVRVSKGQMERTVCKHPFDTRIL